MNKQKVGVLCAALGAISFSSKAILAKLCYRHGIDGVTVLNMRMLLALPFYVLVGAASYKKSNKRNIKTLDLWLLVLMGLMGYYLASLFDFLGLQYIDASVERVIVFTFPTFVVLFSAIFLRKKITKDIGIALFVTYIGILLMLLFGASNIGVEGKENYLKGVVLVFLSAITYAIYLLGSDNLIPKFGAKLFTSISMILAVIAVMVHNWLVHGGVSFDFNGELYIYFILIAIVATVIPTYLLAEAIVRIGVVKTAIIGSLGPVSTIILAGMILNERLQFFQIIGAILVILGVLFISVNRKRNTSKSASLILKEKLT